MGRYGSPGRVRCDEFLHSIIVDPTDFELGPDQLKFLFLSHAEKGGMSVLRDAAGDNEFQITIRMRVEKKPGRSFYGIASFKCQVVRALVASPNALGRAEGDRLYFVLDTDEPGRPHHADIFVTVPRADAGATKKQAWRKQRADLMALMNDGFVPANEFRGGRLVQVA